MEQFNCIRIENCNVNNCPCVWYNHFIYLCEKARIPMNRISSKKLVEINNESFFRYNNIKSKIVDFVEGRNNLIITVNSKENDIVDYGIKLLLNYFSQISYSCQYNTYGLFIDVPQYIDKLKDNIKVQDEDFIRLKQSIDEVPLLVLNNMIPSESKYINEIFYRHISCRANNRLSTVIVRLADNTNASSDNLLNMLKGIYLSI